MLDLKKIFAVAIIATFLASIPLAFAENNAGLVKVVYELKVNGNNAKPPGTPGAKVEPSYVLIAKGLMTTPANIYYQTNDEEDPDFATAITISIEEYEKYLGQDFFMSPEEGPTLIVGAQDYKNVFAFDSLSDNNIIAVTYAWITRGKTKLIVEFDVIFNTYYSWGNAGETSETTLGDTTVMDTWNIVTHEMGHCVGLGDLYKDYNKAQTMFGYATEGETYKRTLNTGDIAGLNALYP